MVVLWKFCCFAPDCQLIQEEAEGSVFEMKALHLADVLRFFLDEVPFDFDELATTYEHSL